MDRCESVGHPTQPPSFDLGSRWGGIPHKKVKPTKFYIMIDVNTIDTTKDLDKNVINMTKQGNSDFQLPTALKSLPIGDSIEVQFLGGEFRPKKAALVSNPNMKIIQDLSEDSVKLINNSHASYYFVRVFQHGESQFRMFPENASDIKADKVNLTKTVEGTGKEGDNKYSKFAVV